MNLINALFVLIAFSISSLAMENLVQLDDGRLFYVSEQSKIMEALIDLDGSVKQADLISRFTRSRILHVHPYGASSLIIYAESSLARLPPKAFYVCDVSTGKSTELAIFPSHLNFQSLALIEDTVFILTSEKMLVQIDIPTSSLTVDSIADLPPVSQMIAVGQHLVFSTPTGNIYSINRQALAGNNSQLLKIGHSWGGTIEMIPYDDFYFIIRSSALTDIHLKTAAARKNARCKGPFRQGMRISNARVRLFDNHGLFLVNMAKTKKLHLTDGTPSKYRPKKDAQLVNALKLFADRFPAAHVGLSENDDPILLEKVVADDGFKLKHEKAHLHFQTKDSLSDFKIVGEQGEVDFICSMHNRFLTFTFSEESSFASITFDLRTTDLTRKELLNSTVTTIDEGLFWGYRSFYNWGATVPTLREYTVRGRSGEQKCSFTMYSFNNSSNLLLNFGVMVPDKLYRARLPGKSGWLHLTNHLAIHSAAKPQFVYYINMREYIYKKEANEESYQFVHGPIVLQGLQLAQEGVKFRHPFDGKSPCTFIDGSNPEKPYGNFFAYTNSYHTKEVFSVLTKNEQSSLGFTNDHDWDERFEDGNTATIFAVAHDIADQIISGYGPVLFHCFGGYHKTGLLALIFRYCSKDRNFWTGNSVEVSSYFPEGNSRVLKTVKANPAIVEYLFHNPGSGKMTNIQFIKDLFHQGSELNTKFSEQIESLIDKCDKAGI